MWEDRFAQEGYLFGTEPVPFLLKHNALFQAGPSALSIAEGEGRNGVYLAKVVSLPAKMVVAQQPINLSIFKEMVGLKNSRGQPIKKARYSDIYKACRCVRFIGDDVFDRFNNKKRAWSIE